MQNRKIRLAVIGTNTISDKVLAGARLDPRLDLVAVYSRTQDRADWFAAKYQIPYTFTSIERMVENNWIDAVYIASPNAFHASQSILCMKHGKHVLCEKPLASNVLEAKQMIAVAQENKVVLMEAMKPTLTPNFGSVMTHLKEIGTLRRYFSCYCQYSSRYDKYKEGMVLNAFKSELSNGAVMDIGIYTIYPMVVLFGAPRSIQASGFKLATGVDAQGSVTFGYDGMTANVIYSKVADSTLFTEIQGEEGTIVLDRINIINDVQLLTRGGEKHSISCPHCGEEYYYEVCEFFNLIESGRMESAINSHRHSLITLEIIDEVRRQLGVAYPADNKSSLLL